MEEQIQELKKEFYSNDWKDCKMCKAAIKKNEITVGFIIHPIRKMYAIINGVTTQV